MKNLHLFAVCLLLIATSFVFGQRQHNARPTSTGGPLIFEHAVYDVKSYDVSIKVDPKTKSISGTTIMKAKIVIPTNVIAVDLDEPLVVSKITDADANPLKYERKGGRIMIMFDMTKQAGDDITTSITYAGTPRVAPNPPWIGGFMWEKTADGKDFISVALQNDGADLMFPVKDHPSDKADEVAMHITVPNPLIATGPGVLQGQMKNDADDTMTFDWLMTNPIPNYSIVFNAAPYKVVEDKVKSISGEMMPIVFYVLPEHADKAQSLIDETKKYTAFFEKYLGPYPFRSQTFKISETPHLGMEHSTNIAYGNKFKYNEDGLDWLMLHEYGHEWWANLVTASDWRDFWIHEGFQSFMDTLYIEETKGKPAYLAAMKGRAKATRNMQPVAPREAKFAHQVYLAEPDYVKSDGDIYGKGAVVLHTLRYLIGDEAFFKSLRRMAYPTTEMEKLTDGRQTRHVNTDDFLHIAEKESGRDLDWFFEVYLRQPKLPKLVASTAADTLNLSWEVPNGLPFEMPVEVKIGGKTHRVEMKNGKGSIKRNGQTSEIDPDGWILKAEANVSEARTK